MQSAYLELLKRTLIDYSNIGKEEFHPLENIESNWKIAPLFLLNKILKTRNFSISKMKLVDKNERLNGYDWPSNAITMIGLNRLNNIESCIQTILKDKIEGDFIETGVWRGGATILMRAILKEFNITNRTVWLADSFKGLPSPNVSQYPADKDSNLHKKKILTCSIEEVKNNFQIYDLLDEQVRFVEGWFKDTLPNCTIEKLSLLRLDGDLYESTFLALEHLYPKLVSGGFVIIDDYYAFNFCKSAVDDYRRIHNIHESIIDIDNEAIFWRKNEQN